MNACAGVSIRIGVLADTHLPATEDAQQYLRYLVDDVLAPVDMILHAGDLVVPELLDVFDGYSVHTVRGNMDPAMPGVPIKKIINVSGFTIGMIHGWGPPDGLEERILSEFSSVQLDCLVYGHSHSPVCHRRDGILFFNPGSSTDRRKMAYHSIGLLEIGDDLRGTIIRLD
jgi:putative phosphoesterase